MKIPHGVCVRSRTPKRLDRFYEIFLVGLRIGQKVYFIPLGD